MRTNLLPTHASVVVIGGGVMGCSTLYHLARAGVGDAILLERNALTSGTTWHSAAQVRALRSTRNLTNLTRYSVDLYQRLEAETGQSTGWIGKGSLSIATNSDRMIHIKRQEAMAHMYGVRAKSISPGEAKERWPLMNADDVVGAVWSPDDGRVGPSDLCAALVKGARAGGARIFEHTSVTKIITRSGKVWAVETAQGTVRCDRIALCTGLWSRAAGALAGVGVPVWPCEHFYLLTKPVDEIGGNLPTLSDHDNHLYIRDDSGGYLVGCFEPGGKPIDPDVLGEDFSFQLLPEDWDQFEPMIANAMHRLPLLEHAETRMLLNGPESFTPDGNFLLGETAETPGLFLGCGMNSVGIASGGGAGMALAHWIQHGAPPADLYEADPNRFPDCFNSASALSERVSEVLGTHYDLAYPARQWSSARDLRRLPLAQRWTDLKAAFTQVYGWERPLLFGAEEPLALTFARPPWHAGVGEEVTFAHEHAAVFDQSPLGKLDVRGRDAEAFLNRVCTNQMAVRPGRALYTLMLNSRGTIEADLTAVRLGPTHYRLYVGTTTVRRNSGWLRWRREAHEEVTITDCTEDFAVLALCGPRAADIASALGGDWLNALSYFGSSEGQLAGVSVRAVRLSYVGESGWELTCSPRAATSLYDALARAGVRPAGLLAQTSMRIEKQFLAFGHEIDTDTDPLSLGLEFALAWDTDFIGREVLDAMRAEGRPKRLVSLSFDDVEAVPLGSEPIYLGAQLVGQTTSASFGHRVQRPVALAYLSEVQAATEGAAVSVDIAGRRFAATVVLGPVFDPAGARMRTR